MTVAETPQSNRKTMSLHELSLILLTLLIWSDRIILNYVEAALMRLPLIGFLAEEIITVIYIVLVVLALPKIIQRLKVSDFLFGVAVVIVSLLSFMIFPSNIPALSEHMPSFLLTVFPLYYIGISLDYEKVYPWLYKISLITIVAFTLYKLFISAPMDDIASMYEGDMWSAYNLLPHVCVVAIGMLKKPGVINVALSVVGIVMLASLGSRGPLLCVLLTMFVYLFLFKSFKRPILSWGLIIGVSLLVVINLESIMVFLYDLADNAGLSVRVFEKFLDGSMSALSSRDVIAEQLFSFISENPILGYGLFADRTLVDTYAHNIAIELWLDFGIFIGTAILAGIIFVLLRATLTIRKRKELCLLFIPLLFAGFIKLFLSGSIFEEPYLFLLMGISIAIIRNHKKERVLC